MALDSLASLIVASFDLSLVRLLRGAIRTADLSQSGNCPKPMTRDRREVTRPPDRVVLSSKGDSQEIVHRVERVDHVSKPSYFRPDVSPAVEWYGVPNDCPESLRSLRGHSPIEPPWKVLPWERLPEPRPNIKVVKIVQRPPDRSHTGALIDCFL